MRGGILSGLLLAGLVLMFAQMSQEELQVTDPPLPIAGNTSGPKKKKDHSVNMPAQEKREPGYTSMTVHAAPEGHESKYGKLPGALRGTRVDGELLADANGRLIIDSSIRQRFDYFLSAASEEGLETAIGRIEENILHTLPPEAADEALGVLNSYINYKKGLQDFLKGTIDFPENLDQVESIRVIMEKRMELRRKYMDLLVVEVFFGDQELYDEFSLKRLELQYNESLSFKEKQDELTRLEQALPEKYRS